MRQALTAAIVCCLALLTTHASLTAADSPYAQAVKSLQPTYYYQLNEQDASGGVIDSMGNAEPGDYNGDYERGLPEAGCDGPLFVNEGHEGIDGGSEFDYFETEVPGLGGEENVAHCSNNEGHVLLGPSDNYGAANITVSLFFHAGPAQGGDRLFTNNLLDAETSFQVNVANEGLVVAVNPNEAGEFAERTLWTTDDVVPDRALIRAEYGWFHVVASTFGDPDERAENIQVWVNGENRTDNLIVTEWGWGVDTDQAKIGGRHEDPAASTTHSGAQDEVAIWLDRVLTDEEVELLWSTAIGDVNPGLPGDYNRDGEVNVPDIDLQSAEMQKADPDLATFDENGDGSVDIADRTIWVQQHANTWYGDSDFNGEFNSSDLVQIFAAGKYETGQAADWGQGDWNGDMEFDSSDLVTAFAAGGYENGPRQAAAVPEPSAIGLVLSAMIGIMGWRRRDN